MKYTVTKYYEYSVVFSVKAGSAAEAEDIADEMDHDDIRDEMLIETIVDEADNN